MLLLSINVIYKQCSLKIVSKNYLFCGKISKHITSKKDDGYGANINDLQVYDKFHEERVKNPNEIQEENKNFKKDTPRPYLIIFVLKY